MSGPRRRSRSDRPSITYKFREEASFDPGDSIIQGHTPASHSKKRKQSKVNVESKRPEILSTREFISAVGQIWDRVNPLSVSESREKLNRNSSCCQRNVILGDLGAEYVCVEAVKDDASYFSVDAKTDSNITTWVQPKFEFLSVTQKMAMIESCSKSSFVRPLFLQFLRGNKNLYSNESWKGKGLANLGFSYEMKQIYGWMKEIISVESPYPVSITNIIEENKTDKICISGSSISHAEGCVPRDAIHAKNNFTSTNAHYFDSFRSKDASLGDNMKVAMKTRSVCLEGFHNSNVITSVSRTPSSSLYVDYHLDMLVPHRSPDGIFQHNADGNEMDEYRIKKTHKFDVEDNNPVDISSSARKRPHYGLAKQQHAYAGAFAGIFVSLCLHPVDTIKTVIQSHRIEQKSVCGIGRSIVSERGVTGLYRGITSNIASSAPISAIYTFTYESVKGSLLPLFSKEYHFLAHCIAGGSASVATSFVFTPSERIKQQMQIGSRYHNCWKALIGIVSNGGLPSLYNGWGAVLCRNIPHSIIKFYTYESLKCLMLPSQNSTAQLTTLQTLACGGFAGSTAALFTTPFDVVKTRLQIQIPGSMSQYNGVFHALKEIGKNEGLKGLYRGLIPRFIMYMSQGALFFASYEFFKRLFSLEVQQFGAQRIQYKE